MLRTLVVEDNRFFREVFKGRLLDYFPSMIIHEAINGKEAMEKINQMPPHLVFMDICLPGSNGLQLTRIIKKYYPNIKIVMLTAFDFPEYRQAAEQDAERFFVKDSLDWKDVKEFVQSNLKDNL
jgi:two-component system response regulator YesN